jgi:hypothetical protein
MHPVSGTFELRWYRHRGDARPLGRRDLRGEPSAASLDATVPARPPQAVRPEPAMAGARRRLDEVSPDT